MKTLTAALLLAFSASIAINAGASAALASERTTLVDYLSGHDKAKSQDATDDGANTGATDDNGNEANHDNGQTGHDAGDSNGHDDAGNDSSSDNGGHDNGGSDNGGHND